MPSRLFPGPDDWYEWRQEPPLSAPVYVRVAPGPSGRLVLTELRIAGEPTSGLLRSIPVGRIEAAANAQLLNIDLGVKASRPAGRRRARHTPSFADNGWDATAPAGAKGRPSGGSSRRVPARLLASGSRGGHHDDLYATVAEIYRDLSRTSHRPAVDIAEANDVPVTTVHRWIKEARRRGFLAPGRPGKTG